MAATLEPCEKTDPTTPIVELDGQLSLEQRAATRRALKRSGVRQSLIKPANNFTGRPAFPVEAVSYGSTARVTLKGGFKVNRKKRSVAVRGLQAFSAPGKPALLKGRIGARTINLFQVKGGGRSLDAEAGELARYGNARLTPAAAKLLNHKLRTGKKKLKAGMVWGYFNLYALYKVIQPDEDPTGKPPVVAPVKPEPEGAVQLSEATTVKWFVRDSFVEYISSGTWAGDGIRSEEGATGDPASGKFSLVYSYNFPFTSGWTVPAGGETPPNTLVKGSGRVAFRYCRNTINFTASDPEIEIDGDDNSRLIFRVNGTDGTPFPDQRAVMVKLIPSLAESHSETDDGSYTTVTYEKIPGFIPAEATGIFAGFYPPFDPGFEGMNPRPDRFGYFSITYSYPNSGGA